MQSTKIKIGQFTLEPFRQLCRCGTPVTLGGKALSILSVLAEANGAVVTKGELMDAVWPGLTVEENAIQVHIGSLRKIFGSDAAVIATVRGLGYQLDREAIGLDPQESVFASHSIAVLNFVNMTGDPNLEHMGAGIAEELIMLLSSNPELKVPSRTSSFAYRDRRIDARQISSELGVDFLVEGSVRLSGNQMRVTAQLINAEDGIHTWSNNFDVELSDLLVAQSDVAAAIDKSIVPYLSSHEEKSADEDFSAPLILGDTLPNFR